MLAAFAAPALAAQVRIGDFRFSCKAPDGKTLKPKFGDIDGTTFIDMPAQYEQCIATIKRMIVGCEMNTDFISNTEAERYPGCLPIFKEQSQACVAFYHREKAKCDAYGTGPARAGDGAGPGQGKARPHEALIASFHFSCKVSDGKTVYPKFGDIPRAYFTDMPAQRDQCLEAINYKIAGCKSNTTFISNTEAERYPGCEQIFEKQAKECAAFYESERAKCDIGSADTGAPGDTESQDAAADADAILGQTCTEGWRAGWTCEGPVKDGKRHGQWTVRHSSGVVGEGPFVDGKEHGYWVFRSSDGDVGEGLYVDGKQHGPWTYRWADGDCRIIEFSRGKMGDANPC